MVRNLVVIAFALLLGGCAASQPAPVVDPLAVCESALQRCVGEQSVCSENLSTTRQSLELSEASHAEALKASEAIQQDLRRCSLEREIANQESESLAQREKELLASLRADIERKDVEISMLNDRLSVRVVDRVLFDTGSADIRASGREVLAKVAAVLAGGKERIRVEGHTDNVPIGGALKSKYFSNWELSGARAASVVRYFQDIHNILPERMEAVGHSFYRPVASNDSDENRQRNRRVEIVLTEPL